MLNEETKSKIIQKIENYAQATRETDTILDCLVGDFRDQDEKEVLRFACKECREYGFRPPMYDWENK